MNFAHFGGGLSKADHAGHVGGVSLVEDAVVNEEEVTGTGDSWVGKVVDFPAAGAAGDDRVEGVALDFFAGGHFRKDKSLDAAFSHAGVDLGEDCIEDLFVELLGLLHDGNLSGRFDLADRFDDVVGFDLVGSNLFFPLEESRGGDVLIDCDLERNCR